MQRWDIINLLIKKYNYKTYLEVGTEDGNCFKLIQLPRQDKLCIDIYKKYSDLDLEISSDDFFKQNKKMFDIIFVDGNHSFEQSYKDVQNSLKCLNENGIIVCHDCNPPNREMVDSGWMGYVFKTILKLRMETDLHIFVVAEDTGCGIISKSLTKFDSNCLSYNESLFEFDNFIKDPKTYLNLVSVDEFKNFIEI
jgi:hypothetical protein